MAEKGFQMSKSLLKLIYFYLHCFKLVFVYRKNTIHKVLENIVSIIVPTYGTSGGEDYAPPPDNLIYYITLKLTL